ncbi:MAG: hypothetical protein OXE79_08985 [Acidimicrobiaceae bacterium]|nr:hypothetical protein [Acidimicrobiaceae bacterium]MCY4176454.1 hypothetical protein [Acidimicrobiaceae bacterium]
MTTAAVRDYALAGADSRPASERGRAEAECFRPPIAPERLRQLQALTCG